MKLNVIDLTTCIVSSVFASVRSEIERINIRSEHEISVFSLSKEEARNETWRNIGPGDFAVVDVGEQVFAVQIGQLQTR